MADVSQRDKRDFSPLFDSLRFYGMIAYAGIVGMLGCWIVGSAGGWTIQPSNSTAQELVSATSCMT